jgi:transposase
MSDLECHDSLKRPKPQNITILLSPTCVNGQEMDVLEPPGGSEENSTTNFLTFQPLLIPDHQSVPTSSMPESVPESRSQTSQDRPPISEIFIPITSSSKILEAGSITEGMDFKPFWNTSSKGISKELWLPTLTDSHVSDSISFNGCSNSLEQYWTLWKNQMPLPQTTLLRTSWKFSQSLQPATTEAENTSIVTRKVKLFLTQKQKSLIQKCLQGHRYFYNKAIEKINSLYETRKQEFQNSPSCVHCKKPKQEDSFCCSDHANKPLPWKLNISFIGLRQQVMKPDSEIKDTELSWQSEIPYDTRQLAIKDVATALKSALTNKKRGNIKNFTMSYKSRRMPKQICWIDSNAIKRCIKKSKKSSGPKKRGKAKKAQKTSMVLRLALFPTRLGEDKYIRVRSRQLKSLPEKFESDCKILKYGKDYYLVYSIEKKKEESKDDKSSIISLDPGVRTFQTGYSPSGVAVKFGERQSELLHKLHQRLDEMRSRRDKSSSSRKQRLRLKCLKIEHAISGTIENLHNQVASYLTKNYETILLPKFSTSVMQKGSLLSSSTKRDLWTLSHYKFQQKLLGLCQARRTTLYIVGEEYTTKTCGGCGSLHTPKAAKIFRCSECPYILDRDVHGARNILLKHLSQHGV